MSFDLDDEILQDFLTEAGEIQESLGEQLVELEANPQNYDLLNAVFRGFHTIKGGAGFLNIEALVEVCHRAEDVFNVLRQGERTIDAHLMDIVLQVVDIVSDMFEKVRNGDEPESVDPSLLNELKMLAANKSSAPAVAPRTESAPVVPPVPAAVVDSPPAVEEEITEDEFDALMDAVQGVPKADSATSVDAATTEPESSEDISEDEFDNLLDELHGAGGVAGLTESAPVESEPEESEPESDDISEDEFDALLDDFHGKGMAPGSNVQPADPEPVASDAIADDSETSEVISENEFDALLDKLHGKGGVPTGSIETHSEAVEIAPIITEEIAPPVVAEAPPIVDIPPAAPPPREIKPVAVKAAEKAAPAETTVRVDTKRLDDIMNMVGELVLVRNRLDTLKASMKDEQVAKAIANLDVVTADLQLAVMKTRMQPIKKVFGRFPRVVRDLARNLKKEVQLEMQGEDTDLDKNLVEALADPLVHLVRNAVDHGIETPEEREAVGKPRKGTVVLSAAQEGDHILLSISDDGKGMDAEVLRRKVVEKELMDHESAIRLDENECYNLIFLPGFSTKSEISDVSGRGVGMDVVKTRIVQMNGTVEITSGLDKGSRITIKVPLTLAIMPTLMVMLDEQIFALPLASVQEIFNLDLTKTNIVSGQLTILVRDKALPLFYLREWLVHSLDEKSRQEGHVLVINAGRQKVCFVVDYLLGQEEVVIKPLGAVLHGLQGMAGATITGDGKIALILDVPGLMKRYAHMS